MWIVTNKGFLSIVAKDVKGAKSGPELDAIVSVRFRRAQDAKAIFPGKDVVMTPGGDYSCRVFATRAEVAEVLFNLACDIDYTNFKNSIPKGDNPLYAAANAAWSVFGKLQPGGPYGGRWPQYDAPPVSTYGGQRDFGFEPKGAALPKPPKHEQRAKARKDPFCDGCGKRFGVKNLDSDGLCDDCASYYNRDTGTSFVDWVAPEALEMADPLNPGECWNCAEDVTERNKWKLCTTCAPLYEGEDEAMLREIVDGLPES